MTHRILRDAGIRVPEQCQAVGDDPAHMLEEHGSVVVKPARGEQGAGVSVGITTREALDVSIERARRTCPDVIVEECVTGDDLRVIVIDNQVVAAAVRRPPRITGTGRHTVRELIEKYSRRRKSATGGESFIPMDEETLRCVREAGFEFDTVLDAGVQITVRKTANVHTGRHHPRRDRRSTP